MSLEKALVFPLKLFPDPRLIIEEKYMGIDDY